MTIQHTVVFRLVHAAGSAQEAEFLRAAVDALTTIPQVDDFAIRRQVSAKSDADWQFSMSFADEADYRAYDEHPQHREFVATRWQTEVADFQEYDFTTYDVGALS
ncbi:Dabb family protein [Microbacterium sp. SS28]|uniref:Dabb family protein n=1 Tax=Microbacterium sp. SS28 TaxID=2919948 RepID=UPI001FA98650|nr:Dabb family protein [Microbacterium sp. SS28]